MFGAQPLKTWCLWWPLTFLLSTKNRHVSSRFPLIFQWVAFFNKKKTDSYPKETIPRRLFPKRLFPRKLLERIYFSGDSSKETIPKRLLQEDQSKEIITKEEDRAIARKKKQGISEYLMQELYRQQNITHTLVWRQQRICHGITI